MVNICVILVHDRVIVDLTTVSYVIMKFVTLPMDLPISGLFELPSYLSFCSIALGLSLCNFHTA